MKRKRDADASLIDCAAVDATPAAQQACVAYHAPAAPAQPLPDGRALANWARRCSISLQQLNDLAVLPIDILIEGETGVGKDSLARLLHDASGRGGAFVAINCAAIPEPLAEAELFGVQTGAFTGAQQNRAGRIEAAHNGTLYLDEIDSMPLALQAKFLRVLQERGCERLGSTRFLASDFRVIASTKLPLERLVADDRFRRDLYYRLNVARLRIPPLRERLDELCDLFVALCAEQAHGLGRPAPALSLDAESQLLGHHWPGNVRELAAAACRHVLGLPLLADDGAARGMPPAPARPQMSLRESLRTFEKRLIERALTAAGGGVKAASRMLRLPEKTLYNRIRKLGIQR